MTSYMGEISQLVNYLTSALAWVNREKYYKKSSNVLYFLDFSLPLNLIMETLLQLLQKMIKKPHT